MVRVRVRVRVRDRGRDRDRVRDRDRDRVSSASRTSRLSMRSTAVAPTLSLTPTLISPYLLPLDVLHRRDAEAHLGYRVRVRVTGLGLGL